MVKYIELTPESVKVCFPVPRVSSKPFPINNLTMRVTREGQKNPIAEYPVEYGESGTICFLIDDDLTSAKSGWYIGVIRHCGKPVHNVRMKVPRYTFGDASVLDAKYGCGDDVCVEDEKCPQPILSGCGGWIKYVYRLRWGC